jgi:hypothetical protein
MMKHVIVIHQHQREEQIQEEHGVVSHCCSYACNIFDGTLIFLFS